MPFFCDVTSPVTGLQLTLEFTRRPRNRGPTAPGSAYRFAITAVECLQYAMKLPTGVVITGCDSMEVLNQALNTARSFRPMSAIRSRRFSPKLPATPPKGKYELFETTRNFDGTTENPQWMG